MDKSTSNYYNFLGQTPMEYRRKFIIELRDEHGLTPKEIGKVYPHLCKAKIKSILNGKK